MAAGLPVLAYPNGSVPEVIVLALDRTAIREHSRARFSITA
jgi:hypothetical protein